MSFLRLALTLGLLLAPLTAQDKSSQDKPSDGPTNEKAQRTYMEALDYVQQRMPDAAFDAFKKADKQDGGHCLACQRRIIHYGIELQEWKAAEAAAEEIVGEAKEPKEVALAHYEFGKLLISEGMDRHKEESFARAHDELTKALAAVPDFPGAVFTDGRALAHLNQDDAAKGRFRQFVDMVPNDGPERQRAKLFIAQPELARAALAPPFSITTIDGQRISLDELQGKVVLLDFWATWCGPCREALPHMKEIAKKFEGQPLIVLSVSVDTDENKWRAFVTKNEMSWPQYLDHGFNGSVARSFNVHAIPHTFTIDADGVLQDEHIGDAAIEGKLKKLIKRAQEKPAQRAAIAGSQL
jgi:thiol-disulfide isomerase/thioredoxin/Tfp pilus assembly protein PilF